MATSSRSDTTATRLELRAQLPLQAPLLRLLLLACGPGLAQGHQASPTGSGDIAKDLLGPCIVVAATLLMATLASAAWLCSGGGQLLKARGSTTHAAAERGAGAPVQRAALRWLGALVVVSVALLVAQLAVGLWSGSLTLIADSAHAGADTVTYAFSYLVELLKARAGPRPGRSLAAKRVDAISAAFSALVIVGTSAYASIDAVERLLDKGDHADAGGHPDTSDEDLDRGIGRALLGFAVAGTLANCALLLLHRRRLAATATRGPATAPLQQWATAEPVPEVAAAAEQVPPPPVLVTGGCSPPPPPSAVRGARGRPRAPGEQRRAPARRKERIAWLHSAFHPGCDAGCLLSGGDAAAAGLGSGDAAEVSATTSLPAPLLQPGSSAPSAEHAENLNVHGALLHLLTDVIRSFVILGAGVLVQCGAFADAARADALCALLVSACVVAGSLALLRSAFAALCPARPSGGGAGALAGGLPSTPLTLSA